MSRVKTPSLLLLKARRRCASLCFSRRRTRAGSEWRYPGPLSFFMASRFLRRLSPLLLFVRRQKKINPNSPPARAARRGGKKENKKKCPLLVPPKSHSIHFINHSSHPTGRRTCSTSCRSGKARIYRPVNSTVPAEHYQSCRLSSAGSRWRSTSTSQQPRLYKTTFATHREAEAHHPPPLPRKRASSSSHQEHHGILLVRSPAEPPPPPLPPPPGDGPE